MFEHVSVGACFPAEMADDGEERGFCRSSWRVCMGSSCIECKASNLAAADLLADLLTHSAYKSLSHAMPSSHARIPTLDQTLDQRP